jgi:hypothetical protein
MNSLETNKSDTIKWLNSKFGLSLTTLPRGNIDDCITCPVAKVVRQIPKYYRAKVFDERIFLSKNTEDILFPEYVIEFIVNLDKGLYPELIC